MKFDAITWHLVRYQLSGGQRKYRTAFLIVFTFLNALVVTLGNDIKHLPSMIFWYLCVALPLLLDMSFSTRGHNYEFLTTRGARRAHLFSKQLLISLFLVVAPFIVACILSISLGDSRKVFSPPTGFPTHYYTIAVALSLLYIWVGYLLIASSVQPARLPILIMPMFTIPVVVVHFRLIYLFPFPLAYTVWFSIPYVVTTVTILAIGLLTTWLAWRRFRRVEIV